jgi:hypothetical protein
MNDFEIKQMKVELEELRARIDTLEKEVLYGTKEEDAQKKDDKA